MAQANIACLYVEASSKPFPTSARRSSLVHNPDTYAVTGQVDAEHARRPSKGVKGEWRAFELVMSQVKSCFTSTILIDCKKTHRRLRG